jgi:hypothetical protein
VRRQRRGMAAGWPSLMGGAEAKAVPALELLQRAVLWHVMLENVLAGSLTFRLRKRVAPRAPPAGCQPPSRSSYIQVAPPLASACSFTGIHVSTAPAHLTIYPPA